MPDQAGVRMLLKLQRENLALLASGLLWLGLVGVGLGIAANYENTPGHAAQASQRWPAESRIQLAPDRPTLVLLAHPRCPCTRASLGELAELMAQCQGLVTASVLFYKPAGASDDWVKTELWQSAAAIPGVTVGFDEAGREALRFNSATSGQVVLYDTAGQLLFSGGITGARGHAGANAGRSAIVELLRAGAAERDRTAVFGCALFATPDPGQSEEVQVCDQ
jgi:hypothetical protein